MTDSKLKSAPNPKPENLDSIQLVSEIDVQLDRMAALKVRKEVLEDAIAIFKSEPSEERDDLVANWKHNIEHVMGTVVRQNAEYLSTIDSAPLV